MDKEAILKAVREAKIPDEHWVEMDKMLKEHNKQCQEIAERQQLSDEDWYKRFTI